MDERALRGATTATSSELAGELAELRAALRGLAERVDRLEHGAAPVATPLARHAAGEEAVVAAGAAGAPAALEPSSKVTLVGRLLLVLAGAFLLRAATEGGQLPIRVGLALGLAYGVAWLFAAHRAGRRGDAAAALFHAVGTTVITYPIAFEAVQRFHALGAGGAALLLAALTALLLHGGWRLRAMALVWLAMAATVTTSIALAASTAAPAPFVGLLVGFAGATLLVGLRRGWLLLALGAAAVADLATLALSLLTLGESPLVAPLAALPAQLSLLLVYLVAVVALARRGVEPDRALRGQMLVATVIGWGGAVAAAAAGRGALPLVVGLLGALLAVAGEALALSALALATRVHAALLGAAAVLALGATALLLPRPEIAWIVLAVLLALAGALAGRPGLELQGALLAACAAVLSGALGAATRALLAPATPRIPWPASALLALAAVVACLLPLLRSSRGETRGHELAAAVLLALLAWLGAGAVATLVRPLLGDDLGLVTAIGTALLAGSASLMARTARARRLGVARWLVYPLLLVAGCKLLFLDVPDGRPLTLFFSLAALGTALLVAARSHGGRTPSASATPRIDGGDTPIAPVSSPLSR